MVREWALTEGELLGRLYEEMVVRGKLASYRGEGDLYGWLGKYVAGYIHRANPKRRREIPVETPPRSGTEIRSPCLKTTTRGGSPMIALDGCGSRIRCGRTSTT